MLVFMAFFGIMALIGSIIGSYLANVTIMYIKERQEDK